MFGGMVVFFMSHKGLATIGDWVVLPIHLFLREYCP